MQYRRAFSEVVRRGWQSATGMILLTAVGCAPAPAPQQAAAPTPPPVDAYPALKAAYLSANPDARVGRVSAVLPGDQRLAVSDMPVGDFHKGDVLSVVDAQLNPVADGTVVDVDADTIYVHYDPVTVGSPAPMVGELAIRAEAPAR